jgi:DNA-binding MltR family transcriptional regulator
MKRPHTPVEIAAAMVELRRASDRAAAVIAMALIESELEQLLRQHFKPVPTAVIGRLFGSKGTLSDFVSKIDMAFAIGLIGEANHRDFDLMRRIRNKFAHRVVAKSFEDHEISQIADHLLHNFTSDQLKTARSRFEFAFFLSIVGLHAGRTKDVVELEVLFDSYVKETAKANAVS